MKQQLEVTADLNATMKADSESVLKDWGGSDEGVVSVMIAWIDVVKKLTAKGDRSLEQVWLKTQCQS